MAVIDNLSTGFEFAIPEGVPLYKGDIADADLLARIFAEQGTKAIMHFAGSIIVPESVEQPLAYYENNTVKSRALIEAAVKGGVKHFIFSSTAATYGIPESSPITEDSPQESDQSLWLVEADDRADARRCQRGAWLQLLRAEVLQCRRCRSAGAQRPVDRGRDASDQGRLRGCDGQA